MKLRQIIARRAFFNRQPDPDKGGKGGAGGVEDDKPEYLTAEQAQEMISKAVNGALSKRNLEKTVGDIVMASLAKFQEAKEAEATEKQEEQAAKGPDAKGELPPAYKAHYDRLEAQLKAEREERLKAEKAREDVEKARRRDEERSTAAEHLRKHGISDARISGALAVLHTERGAIARSEDAKRIVFKSKDKYGNDVELALDEGLQQWLKTDEGKEYLPARDARGSGGAGGKANGQSSKDGSMSDGQFGSMVASMVYGTDFNG